MTCHTRFQAASISKMVFTLSVLRLAAGNKISLNDGISKYLDDIHLQDSNGLSARQLYGKFYPTQQDSGFMALTSMDIALC